MKKRTGIYIIVALLALLFVYAGITYNTLIKKEEKVQLQWAEVQNTYQRRIDLIPNLVNVVKGVSDFESETLQQVTEARARAQSGLQIGTEANAENVERETRLQDSMAVAVNRLIAVVERYPTLKGTTAYAGLQTQLEGTERRIKVARQDFNEAVADYNVAVRSSTTGLVARLFGFKAREGFQADAGADKAVEIKF